MAVQMNIKKQAGDFRLDVSFETEAKRIGILGPSGCGKTMTLKCMAGIEIPDQGSIVVDGRILFDSEIHVNQKPQRRRVGYMFQNYALFPNMTVRQNIGAGIKKSGIGKEKMIDRMILRFHLEGLDHRYPAELSGGEQQRTALARIIASEPEIILMDEPFSALDALLRDEIQHDFFRMLKDYPGTVIMVSHSREEIYRFSEELLIMDRGKTVSQGDCREIFIRPRKIQAARLTGCENILKAQKIDVHHLKISGIDKAVHVQQKIPDGIAAIGIRAADIAMDEPDHTTRSETYSLKFPAKITDIVDMPRERQYYLNLDETQTACITLRCHQIKTQRQKNRQTGENTVVNLPEEKILWLY